MGPERRKQARANNSAQFSYFLLHELCKTFAFVVQAKANIEMKGLDGGLIKHFKDEK